LPPVPNPYVISYRDRNVFSVSSGEAEVVIGQDRKHGTSDEIVIPVSVRIM